MGLKIRLRKHGRTNRPFFRLVVTETGTKRDGKYIEGLGWYNPVESEEDKTLFIDTARVAHWMGLGAEISENVISLLKRGAPEIVRMHSERAVAQRAKAAAKRKARKKAVAK